MYKATKLLKVMAIIFIITGVIGAVSSLVTVPLLEWSEQISGMDLGVEITMLDIVLGVISSLLCVVMSVLALMSKQYKVVQILLLVHVLYVIYGMITSIQMLGFNPIYMTNFAFPALFYWGLISSKIDKESEEVANVEVSDTEE